MKGNEQMSIQGELHVFAQNLEELQLIKKALLESSRSSDSEEVFFSVADDNVKELTHRGITELMAQNWFVFCVTVIPAVSSVAAITQLIIDAVNKKVRKKSGRRRIEAKIRISLPFFSYEKEEIIIIKN